MSEDDEEVMLKRVFDKFDKTRGGYLTADQFIEFIKILSAHIPELKGHDAYTIKSIYKYMDKNGDSKLSFSEIYNWWLSPKKYTLYTANSVKLITKANKLYSSYAKKSQLTYDEFEELLTYLKVQHEDCEFDDIDRNGDGLLSFCEFFDWLGWL